MVKKLKIFISIISLSTCLLFAEGQKYPVYSISQESKIDLLINNKIEQDNVQEQIAQLEERIKEKNNILYEIKEKYEENSEVVTVSFIQEVDLANNQKITEEDLIKQDIDALIKSKEEAKKQLENFMIEGIQIEKSLQEERKLYLKENNLQYTLGIWPLELYTEISSPYGNRIHPISGVYKFHKGIDIPAPQDTDILASDDGIVTFSGTLNGYGNVVKIKHFDGKETVYAHAIRNLAKTGDIVKQGQAISKVGSTGNSTGNHLHFETIVDQNNINPLNAVDK